MSINKDVSITRKRTQDEVDVYELDTRPFVIRVCHLPIFLTTNNPMTLLTGLLHSLRASSNFHTNMSPLTRAITARVPGYHELRQPTVFSPCASPRGVV